MSQNSRAILHGENNRTTTKAESTVQVRPAALAAGEETSQSIILVVDDSPTICRLVATTLEKRGFEVLTAADGMEALAKLNERLPDLILLDITMPRLDGYQLCKIIKGNAATKDTPVIMLSGKDGFFDKVKGRMAGAVGYITKPFKPHTLLETVNKHLDRQQG
ncbi:MAG TPA: response regulator [Anaerolineae bacterium]